MLKNLVIGLTVNASDALPLPVVIAPKLYRYSIRIIVVSAKRCIKMFRILWAAWGTNFHMVTSFPYAKTKILKFWLNQEVDSLASCLVNLPTLLGRVDFRPLLGSP